MKVYNFSKRFLLTFLIFSFLILIFSVDSDCQIRVRTEPKIPDIPGYVTLKCDFHMHTVFSDGNVWPPIRIEEAWREGLNAFSITDHIEYQPHKDDIPTNHNRPFLLAQPSAEALNLIIVKGAEITRGMPPGHINAIFLEDVNPLDTEDYKDAVNAAAEQGAFIFWNHPGWTGQQPDGVSRWYSEHTELYESGWIHGIEVVNGRDYYPLAHKWCLEKKLTMLGNSDVHNPINLDYDFHNGEHRPMTLVFAKEKTEEALKEALFARRTVVYQENTLIGEEKYLKPIFNESVEIYNPDATIRGKSRVYIQIRNNSDISFELAVDGEVEDISVPENITLYEDKTVLFDIRGKSGTLSGRKNIHIPYKVENLLIAPEEGLPVELIINVNFIPVKKR